MPDTESFWPGRINRRWIIIPIKTRFKIREYRNCGSTSIHWSVFLKNYKEIWLPHVCDNHSNEEPDIVQREEKIEYSSSQQLEENAS